MTAPGDLPRRCFLGAAAAAVALAAAPITAMGNSVLPDIAANAFGLRNHLVADLVGTLRELRRIGFRRLELVSFRGWDGHPYGSFTALAGMTGEDVARSLADAGLTATSSHVLGLELQPENLSRTLAWMAPIGVRSLTIAGLPITQASADEIFRLFDGLNETGRILVEQGYRLLLHSDFSLWQQAGSGLAIDDFFRRVDPALCQLQLDLGATLQMGVDPVAIIHNHSAHIGSVHLRDGLPPFDPAIYVPSVALGDGPAPIGRLLDVAQQAGIADFVLEMVMRPEGGELDALARSLTYLTRLATGEMP